MEFLLQAAAVIGGGTVLGLLAAAGLSKSRERKRLRAAQRAEQERLEQARVDAAMDQWEREIKPQ